MADKKLVPHKHAEVIKAFADGKQIEYKDRFDGEWRNIGESPLFMADGEYRIKPEVVKPKWPTFDLPREILLTLIDDYECDCPTITGVSNAAIAHALETGLVVLPNTNTNSSVQNINYKKDAETWGEALNDAAWTFIEDNPEKSALLFNTCKGSLRAGILKYLERVEKDSL